ncbi:hypothetical protein B0H13DRAFT_2368534 [Mycena leptocephala]|nr:hypothetical protein B0H13DRAFT_2368534 [Mycena leptocephala]
MTSTPPEQLSFQPDRHARAHVGIAHTVAPTRWPAPLRSTESAAARAVPSSLRAESEVLPEYRTTLAHPGPAIRRAPHPSALPGHQTDYGLRDLASSQKHIKSLLACKTFASGTCTGLIRRCIRRARRRRSQRHTNPPTPQLARTVLSLKERTLHRSQTGRSQHHASGSDAAPLLAHALHPQAHPASMNGAVERPEENEPVERQVQKTQTEESLGTRPVATRIDLRPPSNFRVQTPKPIDGSRRHPPRSWAYPAQSNSIAEADSPPSRIWIPTRIHPPHARRAPLHRHPTPATPLAQPQLQSTPAPRHQRLISGALHSDDATELGEWAHPDQQEEKKKRRKNGVTEELDAHTSASRTTRMCPLSSQRHGHPTPLPMRASCIYTASAPPFAPRFSSANGHTNLASPGRWARTRRLRPIRSPISRVSHPDPARAGGGMGGATRRFARVRTSNVSRHHPTNKRRRIPSKHIVAPRSTSPRDGGAARGWKMREERLGEPSPDVPLRPRLKPPRRGGLPTMRPSPCSPARLTLLLEPAARTKTLALRIRWSRPYSPHPRRNPPLSKIGKYTELALTSSSLTQVTQRTRTTSHFCFLWEMSAGKRGERGAGEGGTRSEREIEE